MLGLVLTSVAEPKTEIGKVLAMAREKVRRGWCQFVPEEGRFWWKKRYCVLGAIQASSPKNYLLRGEADDAFAEMIGTWNIANWNDDPYRKKEEVLEMFDRTIAWVEKEREYSR